jgi:hypothetical protein
VVSMSIGRTFHSHRTLCEISLPNDIVISKIFKQDSLRKFFDPKSI